MGSSAASRYPTSAAASVRRLAPSRARPRVLGPEGDQDPEPSSSSSSTSSADRSVSQSIVDRREPARAYAERLLAEYCRVQLRCGGAGGLVWRFGFWQVLAVVKDMLEEDQLAARWGRSRRKVASRFNRPGAFLNWSLHRTARELRR